MLVGDRVRVDGSPGVVVAILAEHSFAEGYSAHEWAHLGAGLLVLDDQAGLIHYPDIDGLQIDVISG